MANINTRYVYVKAYSYAIPEKPARLCECALASGIMRRVRRYNRERMNAYVRTTESYNDARAIYAVRLA